MPEITVLQGVLLAIMAIIVGLDMWLEGFFIFRPIIVAPLTGLILGNLEVGIIIGGMTELIMVGLTPVGGTQPPNYVLAGVMPVVLAHTTGVGPKEAIGLALPFGLLMQYIILFYYSSFSVFMGKADRLAAKGDVNGIKRLNLTTTGIVALTYGVIVFLCTYVAQDAMKVLVSNIPEWLGHGLSIAGGILPAVGFGLLLKVMFKLKYLPYLIIGFLVASFISMPNLLPIALIGASFALIVYFNDTKKIKTVGNEGGNINGGI